MKELEAGIDQAWPVHSMIREIKKIEAHFPPGKEGRAEYIDSNHQILALIIERIAGQPVTSMMNNVFRELGMNRTYICEDVEDKKFVPFHYRSAIMHIPRFLTSTGDDIISTARDQMIFLKAFFNGYFFPKNRLCELERWNKIFFPFHYGIGIQKFSLPRIFSPFHPVPEMIGHCGSTGAVAYFVPDRDLYITGTVNQQARPNIAFQTMIKIINNLG
jgi:CubicO group peptidase (beta-lactamase class C family)